MSELYRIPWPENDAGYQQWSADDGTVVTFTTITYQLWNAWKSDCLYQKRRDTVNDREVMTAHGAVANHTAFRHTKAKEPGIHKINKSSDRPEYVIVVARRALKREVCNYWIDQLNEQSDRELELVW